MKLHLCWKIGLQKQPKPFNPDLRTFDHKRLTEQPEVGLEPELEVELEVVVVVVVGVLLVIVPTEMDEVELGKDDVTTAVDPLAVV